MQCPQSSIKRILSQSTLLALMPLLFACSSGERAGEPAVKDATPSLAAVAVPQKVDFRYKGKLVKTLTLDEMKKISPPVEKKITEPHMKVEKTYEAVALVPILDSVYGKKWRSAKDFEFTCIDGYKPIYAASFYKKFDPHLAYTEKGAAKFEIVKPMENNKVADLSPFYIVWDYAKYPAADKMGLSAWVYQIAGIDVK